MDVDLAVWMSDLENLKSVQKARDRVLNKFQEERQFGVAHHQADVFILELGTNRYLGRLCLYGKCPKPEIFRYGNQSFTKTLFQSEILF